MRSALVAAALALGLAPGARALELDWVTVAPGPDCDVQEDGCFGAVGEAYQLSRYEVTNAQYAEFLNAVAVADPNQLFVASMNQDEAVGGIRRMGLPGSWSYEVKPGWEDKPIAYADFRDTQRFANWLHNGQPTGPQGSATTEDGAYVLTDHTPGPRRPGARYFVPDEDEWYRAAYYDAGTATFFDYPVGSDTQTTCEFPEDDTGNAANCEWFGDGGGTTPVGAFALSASPSGTFDQGGNLDEWIDTHAGSSLDRLIRGGNWVGSRSLLAASRPRLFLDADFKANTIGFRVARRVPACQNGLDDDGDGAADLSDVGCGDAEDLDEHDATLPCDDGLDNDGDGLSDYPADPVCQSAWYHRESGLCQDGLDNDGDGRIDFDGGASHNGGVPLTPPDPQCAGVPWQNREAALGCGLGAELALLVPLLQRVASRRRRRGGPAGPG